MQNIVIFGATSAIAEATARIYAERGDKLFLVGRNEVKLQDIAADLKIRGANLVEYLLLDINKTEKHAACLEQISAKMARIDLVLIAHGTLSDQQACEQSVSQTLQEIQTNALSSIALLTLLANLMENQRTGTLAVISSVAGDRGRQSNYVYGAAKAMLSTFLQGLRNRLNKHNVHVLTIKPGFVDTPMTAAFSKGPLWAQPEKVAEGIVKSVEKKRAVAYLPGFWRFIMLAIIHIPEFIFKRMSL